MGEQALPRTITMGDNKSTAPREKVDEISWTRLGQSLDNFRESIRELPVAQPVTQEEIIDQLRRYDFQRPITLDELTEDVIRLFRNYSVQVTHPRYFGLFNPGVHNAGIIAETLAAVFNPQLAAWSHSPIANEIEQHVLQVFSGLLGFPNHATAAHFTTGGQEANLTAVLVALNHKFPEWAEQGLATLKLRPRIYMSADSHGSILKAARICGLGSGAVRSLPTRRPSFVVDSVELENAIAEDQKNGYFPLMVVGTAGTTSTGAVDPLPSLATLARKHGAWFHVDAAWGGSACLSPKLRKHIAGIELADSVTWDAHKWLSVPFSAGMFFSKHVESVYRAFSIQTGYMPARVGEALDPYATTIQWTRRTMGLKVFMSLAQLGLDGYCRLIEGQAEMGNFLRQRLKEEGYDVVNDTALPLSCFTHPLIRKGRLTTTEVLKRIYARGKVWISDVSPGEGERLLRACVTHYETNSDDIDCLIEELKRALSVPVS
jgi:glutamate/tyrosine decarboxylase-like PLP-dependent enzyme